MFKLHSKGENWFHFRKELDSTMESFSVTFCHDGTVVMTGDYGCLSWQRQYFPERPDYGFPNKLSGIGYFAEKVVRAEQDQKIKTWNKELAEKEIRASLDEYIYEKSDKMVKVLEDILDKLEWFESNERGYFEMLEAFCDAGTHIDSEVYCEYGRCYTEAFQFKYDVLVSVSEIIINEIKQRS